MKINYFIFSVFIFLCFSTFANNNNFITGTVRDKLANKPLQYVQVYVDGTTMGCLTDEQGRFELEMPAGFKFSIVASMVGYKPFNVEVDGSQNKSFTIFLESRIHELSEFYVEGLDKRNANIKAFNAEFFGRDEFGSQCILLNDSVLNFNIENGIKRVTASAPLKFINPKLAYSVYADLIFFEYNPKTIQSMLLANMFYVDMSDSKNKRAYKQIVFNRRKAYYGNREHFIKAMFNNSLEEEGFVVVSDTEYFADSLTNKYMPKCINKAYLEQNSQMNEAQTKRMVNFESDTLFLIYYAENRGFPRDLSQFLHSPFKEDNLKKALTLGSRLPLSLLYINAQNVEFSNTGNAEFNVLFNGKMGRSRYGCVLPLDYDPKSD